MAEHEQADGADRKCYEPGAHSAKHLQQFLH